MTEEAKSSVILVCPDSLPERVYLDFAKELETHGVSLKIEKTRNPSYAGLEWAVPSAVAAYLLKPFLETLLKKAAEEAYPAIKTGFKKLLGSLFGSERASRARRISLSLSLYFESRDGYRVKALIWEGIPAEMQNEAIDKLFALIELHYKSETSDQLRGLAPPSGPPLRWGMLFLRFDLEKRIWEPVDIVVEALKRE